MPFAMSTSKSAPSVISDSLLPSQKTSKRNANACDIDAAPQPNSPSRRSKRLKSDVPEASNHPPAEGDVVEPKSKRPQNSRTRVKKGVEEESEFSISVETEENDAVQQEKPKVLTAKATKKRKTKEEKETEVMPLRPRTQGLRMFVGAHVSAAKGVFNAVNNTTQIGGNAFALFLKSQRKWNNPPLQDGHRDQFRQSCSEQKYNTAKHVLPHGSYLVNLAQEDKAKAKQAYNSFLDDLQRCEALGINLYNFHPGSAGQTTLSSALTRLAKALTNALAATSTVTPVLETMCGQGTTIGGSLTEFRDIIAQIPKEHHSRVGICIDTCHSHAAGYDLVTPAGFKAFLKEFDEVIGLQFLRALHLNDSKTPRGSHRDLHANIGTGFLGLRAFHNIMNEPTFEDMPMILETPIDRPVSDISKLPTTDTSATAVHEACASEDSESDLSDTEQPSRKKQTKGKAKKPTARVIADPSVWASEISLLESLIGMDPESPEFRSLEIKLADEGKKMREKHQEQHDRKLETEEKKRKKALEKGQKSLMDMMKGSPAAKGKKKTTNL